MSVYPAYSNGSSLSVWCLRLLPISNKLQPFMMEKYVTIIESCMHLCVSNKKFNLCEKTFYRLILFSCFSFRTIFQKCKWMHIRERKGTNFISDFPFETGERSHRRMLSYAFSSASSSCYKRHTLRRALKILCNV